MGQTFSEPVTEKETSCEQDKNFLVASSSIQGWRISMEDAHTIWLSMPEDEDAAFFGVYDGHGGAKVANYASENLYRSITSSTLYKQGNITEALKQVFVEFDEMMFNDEKMRDELAGSTAIVILIKNSVLYCANIGDSRAVASYNGIVDPLSIDHKPTCPDEMSRVVAAGGWVQFNRVNGNLALSRAFGDFVFKRNEKRSAVEQIVIAYPDVQTRPMKPDLEFIVIACDGVWDVMTNEEVIEFCRRRIIHHMPSVLICEELITRCLAPDCQMGSGIGCDNMTVILISYLNGGTYDEFCDRVAKAPVNPKKCPFDQQCKSNRRVKLNMDIIMVKEDDDHDHNDRNGPIAEVLFESDSESSDCNSSASSFDDPMLTNGIDGEKNDENGNDFESETLITTVGSDNTTTTTITTTNPYKETRTNSANIIVKIKNNNTTSCFDTTKNTIVEIVCSAVHSNSTSTPMVILNSPMTTSTTSSLMTMNGGATADASDLHSLNETLIISNALKNNNDG